MYQNKIINKMAIMGMMLFIHSAFFCQSETTPEASTSSFFSMNLTDFMLLIIAICLLIPIYYMSKIFTGSLNTYLEKVWKNKKLSAVILMFIPFAFYAQADAAATTTPVASFLDSINFWRFFLILIIFFEILALIVFCIVIYKSHGYTSAISGEAIESNRESSFMRWWKKINNFGALEDDAKIDLGHNYDGIRELDNKIPAWFTGIFLTTLIFGVVYVWRYHVAQISPLQTEEYLLEEEQANKEYREYLKTSGSSINEEALAFSTDKSDIESGKKMFAGNCATCHKEDGGGGTGPNLTDENWINGCSPKDIYQSIKYGRKNGMMAWKDNFNDKQITELMNYVHSLKGTKPAAPKAVQGEVCNYVSNASSPADSAKVDSIKK